MHRNLHDRMKAMRAGRLNSPTLLPFVRNSIAFAKRVVDSEIKLVGGIGNDNERRLAA